MESSQQTIQNIYDCNDENIRLCAQSIQQGDLVIFPTETVYGLGACALNEDAINKIYKLKKRPNNNPLIIHVINWSEAEIYVDINQIEANIINILVKEYWPGPLTLLVKKEKFVPDIVTANSKWVAIRSPSNKIARKLLEYAMVPIAAPSANISGKITSTCKEHILNYFGDSEVSMLLSDEPCKYGTESTIVKVENNTVSIIRPGLITFEMISNTLVNIQDLRLVNNNITKQIDSPGTSLSHYTTSKNTLLFNFVDIEVPENSYNSNINEALKSYLDVSACIDFGSFNFHYKELFFAYVDLSKNNDINEAIFNLYNVLHQLDKLNIKNILIFDYYSDKKGLYKTLFDRMYRCCSGKKILIPINI